MRDGELLSLDNPARRRSYGLRGRRASGGAGWADVSDVPSDRRGKEARKRVDRGSFVLVDHGLAQDGSPWKLSIISRCSGCRWEIGVVVEVDPRCRMDPRIR